MSGGGGGGGGDDVTNILGDILKVEGIEEAFSCFLVHRAEAEKEKMCKWQQELNVCFKSATTAEQLDVALRQYLAIVATCSHNRLQLLMELLESLVRNGTLGARPVCETIINNDKLQYQNKHFWIECFRLVRKIIDLVEYKGVREIMKVSLII